ncbi:hypothetical protein [Haladaptatus pallidirubidus]|uniref:Uncharacterized protein n=2 Tax=Haladaptatus pallidirubidus TaxID=1008152 RepID=A0AAV3UEW9_9EURY|nr:hypothetical protein [Haladaptatus pallidirubidus]
MNRVAKLLLAVTVAGMVFSGTVPAERTDKKGQYAEANLSHFELDSRPDETHEGERFVFALEKNDTPSPRIVADDRPRDGPNDESAAFEAANSTIGINNHGATTEITKETAKTTS